jgi:hypothetical protein
MKSLPSNSRERFEFISASKLSHAFSRNSSASSACVKFIGSGCSGLRSLRHWPQWRHVIIIITFITITSTINTILCVCDCSFVFSLVWQIRATRNSAFAFLFLLSVFTADKEWDRERVYVYVCVWEREREICNWMIPDSLFEPIDTLSLRAALF